MLAAIGATMTGGISSRPLAIAYLLIRCASRASHVSGLKILIALGPRMVSKSDRLFGLFIIFGCLREELSQELSPI
jgi:hypothetical protein